MAFLRLSLVVLFIASSSLSSIVLYGHPGYTSQRLQRRSPKPSTNAQIKRPEPPPGGPPTDTRGAGTMGSSCPKTTSPLIALAPVESFGDRRPVWGLTHEEQPILWFYLPYRLTDTQPGEFSLRDKNGKTITQTITGVGAQTGVIGIRLPRLSDSYSNYLWNFTVRCDKEDSSKNKAVQGWIQRVDISPALAEQLKKQPPPSPLERYKLYLDNNLKFDALTSLAQLRMDKPNDEAGATTWESLLRDWNFEDVSQAPVIEVIPIVAPSTPSGQQPTPPRNNPTIPTSTPIPTPIPIPTSGSTRTQPSSTL
jgi:hypothetical protein